MRLIDADAIAYELWTTEVDSDRDDYRYFQNRFMVDRRDIESMPTVQQWIPCSERLPDKGLRVLMQLNNAWQIVGWYDKEDKQWYALPFSQEVVNNCVLAWMPLPEPYRGDDK